MREYVAQLF